MDEDDGARQMLADQKFRRQMSSAPLSQGAPLIGNEKMAEKKTGKTVTVEQTGSPIRRPADQRATLVGLGLNKMHRRSTLEDTPAVRGMIAKVAHLVRVVDEA